MLETNESTEPDGAGAQHLVPPTVALSRRFELAAPEHDDRAEEYRDSIAERRRGFRIGTVGLVPEAATLCEVIESPRLYPVPNSVGTCLGMMNLRGMLIPAFSAHFLLGVGAAREAARWFIVMGEREMAGALAIDGLPVQLDLLPEAKIRTLPPLPEVIQSLVRVGYRAREELWFEIDHAEFFEAIAGCQDGVSE